eukprot:SM000130S27131  [mRNA]  locus=s130:311883:314042:- [translate_table: standard]
MSRDKGGSGGQLVEVDRYSNLVATYPPAPTPADLQPYGVAVTEVQDLFMTTDYIVPSSAYAGSPGLQVMSTVRIWGLSNRTLLKTVTTEAGAGNFAAKFIALEGASRAYVTGAMTGRIYLVEPKTNPVKVTVVLDLTAIYGYNPVPHHIELVAGGLFNQSKITYKRGFISLNAAGSVIYFDYTNATSLKIIDELFLGTGSGPSYIRVSNKFQGYRLAVANYALDLNNPGATPNAGPLPTPYGTIHQNGDHKVYMTIYNETSLVLDPKWIKRDIDFDTIIQARYGSYTPCGMAFYPNVGIGNLP